VKKRNIGKGLVFSQRTQKSLLNMTTMGNNQKEMWQSMEVNSL